MDLQLKRLRKNSELTQTDLAERIGVSMRVISSWERQETELPLEDAARTATVSYYSNNLRVVK